MMYLINSLLKTPKNGLKKQYKKIGDKMIPIVVLFLLVNRKQINEIIFMSINVKTPCLKGLK